MTLNDPLANALSKTITAEKLSKETITVYPASKLIKNVFEVLNKSMYIGDYVEKEDDKGNYLIVNLLGRINKCGVVKPRFSAKKAGFEKFEKRFLPSRDFGILIVSTPKGLMTHKEAIKNNLGGRIIAYCY